jgi:hypothetical protein
LTQGRVDLRRECFFVDFADGFRRGRFEAEGPMSGRLAAIPAYLIVRPDSSDI